jgi:hypothetical protein
MIIKSKFKTKLNYKIINNSNKYNLFNQLARTISKILKFLIFNISNNKIVK